MADRPAQEDPKKSEPAPGDTKADAGSEPTAERTLEPAADSPKEAPPEAAKEGSKAEPPPEPRTEPSREQSAPEKKPEASAEKVPEGSPDAPACGASYKLDREISASTTKTAAAPSLFWTGTGYDLFWQTQVSGTTYDLMRTRLSSSGAKIGSDSKFFQTNQKPHFVLAWTGKEYGMVWTQLINKRDTHLFVRLSASGAKIGQEVQLTRAHFAEKPALVWTGKEFVLVRPWVTSQHPGVAQLYLTRISATGTVIGSEIRVSSTTAEQLSPSLVWTGKELGLAWKDKRHKTHQIYFSRLSPTGSTLGAAVRVFSGPFEQRSPSLVWTGKEFGVSWEDRRHSKGQIYFARLSATGVPVGTAQRLSSTTEYQQFASLTWTGRDFGLLWEDARHAGKGQLYFQRLSSSGTKIGTEHRVSPASDRQLTASFIWTGKEFGLSWIDTRGSNPPRSSFRYLYFGRLLCK